MQLFRQLLVSAKPVDNLLNFGVFDRRRTGLQGLPHAIRLVTVCPDIQLQAHGYDAADMLPVTWPFAQAFRPRIGIISRELAAQVRIADKAEVAGAFEFLEG